MIRQQEKRALLLIQSPTKLMVTLSLPAVIGMLVIGLYPFVDAIYAGQLIGVDAIGAIAVAGPFTLINSGIGAMIGMGSASVLSRAIGSHNQRIVDQVMGNLVVMNIVLSLTVSVLGIAFARPLLMLTGAEGNLLDMAVSYLRIIFIGGPFLNFAQSATMILRGEGEIARAMWMLGGGAVLNIILAPLFILALRDQGLGIEGAAIAAVLSQVVLAGFVLWWFLKHEKTARIVRLCISTEILSEIIKVGISSLLMQVLTLVQQAVIFRAAAEWGGQEWQILFGASMRIMGFVFIPLWGMSNGFQPAAGTNFGAKLYDRVRKVTLAFCLGSTGLALLFWIPVMLAPHALLSLFITDPNIVAMGVGDFRVMFSSYIIMGIMVMSITLLQAVGQAGKAALLALARPLLLFVPLVLIVPLIADLGIDGVWLACALTDVFTAVLGVAMMMGVLRRMGKNDSGTTLEDVSTLTDNKDTACA